MGDICFVATHLSNKSLHKEICWYQMKGYYTNSYMNSILNYDQIC